MKIHILLFLLLLSAPVLASDIYPFTTPDFPLDFAENFSSLYIASYTFSNEELANIISTNAMNIILVDGSPVGGFPDKELLCSLDNVFLYKGEKNYMHAKYIIKDNTSVLITSENFGSFENKGWGAIVEDKKIAEDFLQTFLEDLSASEPLYCDKKTELDVSYSDILDSQPPKYKNQKTTPITKNYPEALLDLINSANSSILIEQFYIHKQWSGKISPLLEAIVKKAESGVGINVLLDSTWYNIEKNNETIEYLKENGIEAKFYKGNKKIHNKGMIIDDKIVLISSINWNENSVLRNIESGIIIEGDVAEYFSYNFWKDWNSNIIRDRDLNLYKRIATLILVVGLAAFLARRR